MTRHEKAGLMRSINAYRDAAIGDAFKGAAHPDDRDSIEYHYVQATARLKAILERHVAK